MDTFVEDQRGNATTVEESGSMYSSDNSPDEVGDTVSEFSIPNSIPSPPEEFMFRNHKMSELNSALMVGRQFHSVEEAESFFSKYATSIGFSLRRDSKRSNSNGVLTIRSWVCSRQGFRSTKNLNRSNRKRQARALTRVGCAAQFKVNFQIQSQMWVVTVFDHHHNHELAIGIHKKFLSHDRVVSEGFLAQARHMRTAGIKTCKIMEYVAIQKGGYAHLPFTSKDLHNILDAEKKMEICPSDAETALAYLCAQAEKDLGFFLKYAVDEEKHLSHIFWSDSIMQNDYNIFGEVVVMDATYKTNVYKMPLVIIVGMNHHYRSTIFAFGLLANEKLESYEWLLSTFAECMKGKLPTSIITDSDASMRKALRRVFPDTNHRLCCWHLAQNAQQQLNSVPRVSGFIKCMMKKQRPEEFEVQWASYVDNNRLAENEWVRKMYGRKEMWAEAYNRGKFFGFMRSNQRCESMNSILKPFVDVRIKLYRFVRQMDRAVARSRYMESYEDFQTIHSNPTTSTHLSSIEKSAATLLTRKSFDLFREEMDNEKFICIVSVTRYSDKHTYVVTKYPSMMRQWVVTLRVHDNYISCDCLAFETDAIPCSHMYAVMKAERFTSIPNCLVNNRWKRDVKKLCSLNVNVDEEVDEYVKSARFGVMNSLCNRLCYMAAESEGLFNSALQSTSNLLHELERQLCEASLKSTTSGEVPSASSVIRDPKVVRAKGCGPPNGDNEQSTKKKYKCQWCKQRGHNIRSCELKLAFDMIIGKKKFGEGEGTTTANSPN